MIEFHFFLMPMKTLGSLGKIRVGRVTGNIHIFFGLISILGGEMSAYRTVPGSIEIREPVLVADEESK